MEGTRYLIEYTEEAKNDIKGLQKTIARIIKKAIEERLMTAPNEYGEPLLRNLKGYRRLRVASYRVIYKVDEGKVTVLIIKIGNRRDVYE